MEARSYIQIEIEIVIEIAIDRHCEAHSDAATQSNFVRIASDDSIILEKVVRGCYKCYLF